MAKARASSILGPDGEPLRVDTAALPERTMRPSVVGFRRAQAWRSVITGLTPQRLRYLLHALAQGTWTPDAFELFEEMEERDLHYRGVLQQRKLAAAGAALEVLPASDAARDLEHADLVRAEVLGGRGAHDARIELLDAVGKGFSCQEIVWAMRGGRWTPARYYRIDQRWIVFDDEDGVTPYLIGDRGMGEAGARAPERGPGAQWGWGRQAMLLAPAKHLWHVHRSKSGLPARGGLAYAAATMYLLKSVAVKDWWAFAEVFGLPVRVGKYGPNATDDDIQTLIDAIGALASDAGAVIPDSMMIELVEAAKSGTSRGDPLFQGMADWCDKQVSKAVVGQTMTVDDGSSLAQAQIHDDIRADLVDDDIRQMCDTLSDTVVAWYCQLNGLVTRAGMPRIAPPGDEDAIDVSAVTAAVRSGLRVGQAWMRGRMGIPDPAEDEDVLSGLPPGGGAPGGEGEALPPPAPNALGLHAAEDPRDGSPWLSFADDLIEPVMEALDAAADADDFLALASRAGVSGALAADVALRCFESRVSGEVDPEPRR